MHILVLYCGLIKRHVEGLERCLSGYGCLPGSVPSTHMVIHKHPELQFQYSSAFLWPLQVVRGTQTYAGKILIHIK